jgi:uncharacterized protein (DUF934 family)
MLIGLIVAMSLLSGCATLQKLSGSVPPEYATAIDLVAKSVSSPKSSKTETTLNGFTYREVYRYKGTVCDASDVSRERIYAMTQVGADAFESTSLPITATPEPSTPTTNTNTTTSDEQAAERIAEALDKLIPPTKKK